MLAIETIPCMLEAKALTTLLSTSFPTSKAWLSFSCRDGSWTNAGDLYQDCVSLADRCEQVIAVGVNCTSPEHLSSLIAIARAQTSKPIIVYPNRGDTWDSVTNTITLKPLEVISQWPTLIQEWHRLGASIIGGCCHLGPKYIESIATTFPLKPA